MVHDYAHVGMHALALKLLPSSPPGPDAAHLLSTRMLPTSSPRGCWPRLHHECPPHRHNLPPSPSRPVPALSMQVPY